MRRRRHHFPHFPPAGKRPKPPPWSPSLPRHFCGPLPRPSPGLIRRGSPLPLRTSGPLFPSLFPSLFSSLPFPLFLFPLFFPPSSSPLFLFSLSFPLFFFFLPLFVPRGALSASPPEKGPLAKAPVFSEAEKRAAPRGSRLSLSLRPSGGGGPRFAPRDGGVGIRDGLRSLASEGHARRALRRNLNLDGTESVDPRQ